MNVKNFAKILKEEAYVYTLLILNIVCINNSTISINAVDSIDKDINMKFEHILSTELKKYQDVFFVKKTSKLFLNVSYDYFIKITAKLSYNSLYNLLNTKLAALKKYLNNVLVKE